MNRQAQQGLLVEAILGRAEPSGLRCLPGIEGGEARALQAYRGNAKALAARALGSAYPRLLEELGEAQFGAMAWAFWRAHPPVSGDMADWGDALAGFLQAQPGMEERLVDEARLDWALHEAARAADAVFDGDSLALLGSGDPARLRLRLRPGTAVLGRRIVWRSGWRALHEELDDSAARFMQAQLDGASLVDSMEEGFDFGAWLQQALRQGWLIGAEEIQ
ncbi:MAG: putative DNA-binding domain-containing protein [Paucibacter sp.]|nr:putative DNA-binding domain-containing protein [Roseateles sp.]